MTTAAGARPGKGGPTWAPPCGTVVAGGLGVRPRPGLGRVAARTASQAHVVAAGLLILALAGCATPQEAALDTGSFADARMAIAGLVRDTSFAPVADANVTLRGFDLSQTTGADGTFLFSDLDPRVYLIDASADGHETASVAVRPTEGTAGVEVVLPRIPVPEATQQTQAYRGVLQCAAEALIISGSCDVLLAFTNDAVEPATGQRPLPEPLESDHIFDFHVGPDWTTLVVDVVFDPDVHPGLDGLRTVLRGLSDSGELALYEQYGRWWGDVPYTFHVTPGGTYTDGDGPVPGNTTMFRLETLPHSHAYHATCPSACLLGVGATIDLEFELFVTQWHVEPAPEGWSLQSPGRS